MYSKKRVYNKNQKDRYSGRTCTSRVIKTIIVSNRFMQNCSCNLSFDVVLRFWRRNVILSRRFEQLKIRCGRRRRQRQPPRFGYKATAAGRSIDDNNNNMTARRRPIHDERRLALNAIVGNRGRDGRRRRHHTIARSLALTNDRRNRLIVYLCECLYVT